MSLCLRPEALRIVGARADAARETRSLEATVMKVEFIGALVRLEVELADGTSAQGGRARRPKPRALRPAAASFLAYDPARVTVFRQGKP